MEGIDYYNHKMTSEKIQEVVATWWDLSGIFPIPKRQLQCSQCNGKNILIKDLYFMHRPEHRGRVTGKEQRRCDVACKCCECSCVFVFGLNIPEEMWQWHVKAKIMQEFDDIRYWYHWKTVQHILKITDNDRNSPAPCVGQIKE